jgi:4-amino-4-deoxy-L-arabinose transferase-like glycosyltransferase
LALAMALGSPLLVYQGVVLDGDDVLYARLASDMAQGHPTFGINTHTYRLGFIVPLAALYSIFGIHDWTTVAFTLVSGLATVLMAAFAADRLYGRPAGAWAALFCGFSPVLYRFGSTALADVPAGFLYGVFVAGWLLIVTKRVRHRRGWAVMTGMACAWAVATRESTGPMILITGLGFLLVGWRQATLREFPLREWLLGCALISVPYLFYLGWHTGTPLYFLGAAQGGYNVAGAPWVQPLEGLRLGARLAGLSILRAMIEGYLVAILPVVVAVATGGRSAPGDLGEALRRHLLVAVASPLVVLSHFSTSLSQWVPVYLDLRFGSPLLIPAGVLVAGACLSLPGVRPQITARVSTGLTAVAAGGVVWLGWAYGNRWSMLGAAATSLAGIAVLCAPRLPRFCLPAIPVLLLVGHWGLFLFHEYPEETARVAAMRQQAQAVPRDPMLPVLTDPLTAQVLPYLNKFENPPQVATWTGPGEVERPFYWTERTDRPWARNYLLVWHPDRARTQAQRWGTEVPAWVQKELQRGRLVQAFPGEPEAGIYLVESVPGS